MLTTRSRLSSVWMKMARMEARGGSGDGAEDALAGAADGFAGVGLENDERGHGDPVAMGDGLMMDVDEAGDEDVEGDDEGKAEGVAEHDGAKGKVGLKGVEPEKRRVGIGGCDGVQQGNGGAARLDAGPDGADGFVGGFEVEEAVAEGGDEVGGGLLGSDERGFESGKGALEIGVEVAVGGEGGTAIAGALAESGFDGLETGGEPAGDLRQRVARIVCAELGEAEDAGEEQIGVFGEDGEVAGADGAGVMRAGVAVTVCWAVSMRRRKRARESLKARWPSSVVVEGRRRTRLASEA